MQADAVHLDEPALGGILAFGSARGGVVGQGERAEGGGRGRAREEVVRDTLRRKDVEVETIKEQSRKR